MDITPIVNAVIALVATVISVVLIPWIKGKMDAQKLAELKGWVDVAVSAAEQLYGSNFCDSKKVYVQQFLAKKGYIVDDEAVENMIEASVLHLHNQLYGNWTQEEDGEAA